MRIMSDAYGKGIVRGQVENTNLRAYAKDNDVTFAEAFRTGQTEAFYGREYVDLVERMNDKVTGERRSVFGEVDRRNPRRHRVTFKDVALLYGQRPQEDSVWFLSPYEFVAQWEPVLVNYPLSLAPTRMMTYHATLTDAGRAKLSTDKGRCDNMDMTPGVDYLVGEGVKDQWLPYPDIPSTQHFRHTWVLERRRRAKIPSLAGAPVPRHGDREGSRAAMITMAYFRPWTLRVSDACSDVAYVGRLRPPQLTWQDACQAWLDGGIVCEEAKRYVGNFLSVYRVRPQNDDDSEVHSSDVASDEELEVSHAASRPCGHASEGREHSIRMEAMMRWAQRV